MIDEIGQYITGGEPAKNFGPNARVWGEMAVRKIVMDVLKNRAVLPIATDVLQPEQEEPGVVMNMKTKETWSVKRRH